MGALAGFVKALLYGMASAFGSFANFGASVLQVFVSPAVYTSLMSHPAVYESWKVVRDIFNLAFIIILLFSAFATIFQIEKYHIKRILLSLVLMALLVNFSFPIARFVGDAANVPMYFLLQAAFPADDPQRGIASAIKSGLPYENILLNIKNVGIAEMIGLVLFLLIFAITVFAFAILLLIRVVALVILVIFSPVGFVASILPSTQSHAQSYWNNLMKYAFMGPLLILILLVSLKIFTAFNGDRTFQQAKNQYTASVTATSRSERLLIEYMENLIPVIILWAGLMMAQRMGTVGASLVTGKAISFGKKIGKLAAGIPSGYYVGRYVARKAKSGFKKRMDATKSEYSTIERLGEGAAGLVRAVQQRWYRVTGRVSRGARRKLAEQQVGEEKWRQRLSKGEAYDPVAIHGNDEAALRRIARNPEFDITKASINTLQDENFMRILVEERGVTEREIQQVIEKGREFREAIVQGLERAIQAAGDIDNRIEGILNREGLQGVERQNREQELRNRFQEGLRSASDALFATDKERFFAAVESLANQAHARHDPNLLQQAQDLLHREGRRLTERTARGINAQLLQRHQQSIQELVQSLNPARLKSVLEGIEDREAQRTFLQVYVDSGRGGLVQGDAFLRTLAQDLGVQLPQQQQQQQQQQP